MTVLHEKRVGSLGAVDGIWDFDDAVLNGFSCSWEVVRLGEGRLGGDRISDVTIWSRQLRTGSS